MDEMTEKTQQSPAQESRLHSIDLTSYLVARGHRLAGLAGPPQRLTFIFFNIPQAEIEAFENGTAMIPAKKFADTRTCLYDLIRARKEEQHRFQQLEGQLAAAPLMEPA